MYSVSSIYRLLLNADDSFHLTASPRSPGGQADLVAQPYYRHARAKDRLDHREGLRQLVEQGLGEMLWRRIFSTLLYTLSLGTMLEPNAFLHLAPVSNESMQKCSNFQTMIATSADATILPTLVYV